MTHAEAMNGRDSSKATLAPSGCICGEGDGCCLFCGCEPKSFMIAG